MPSGKLLNPKSVHGTAFTTSNSFVPMSDWMPAMGVDKCTTVLRMAGATWEDWGAVPPGCETGGGCKELHRVERTTPTSTPTGTATGAPELVAPQPPQPDGHKVNIERIEEERLDRLCASYLPRYVAALRNETQARAVADKCCSDIAEPCGEIFAPLEAVNLEAYQANMAGCASEANRQRASVIQTSERARIPNKTMTTRARNTRLRHAPWYMRGAKDGFALQSVSSLPGLD